MYAQCSPWMPHLVRHFQEQGRSLAEFRAATQDIQLYMPKNPPRADDAVGWYKVFDDIFGYQENPDKPNNESIGSIINKALKKSKDKDDATKLYREKMIKMSRSPEDIISDTIYEKQGGNINMLTAQEQEKYSKVLIYCKFPGTPNFENMGYANEDAFKMALQSVPYLRPCLKYKGWAEKKSCYSCEEFQGAVNR